MDVVSPMSNLVLTPDMAVGGLCLEQAEASFSKSIPGILDVVRHIEERLCRGR